MFYEKFLCRAIMMMADLHLYQRLLNQCLFLWFCMGKLRSGGEIFYSVGVAAFQSWTALRMVIMKPAQGRLVVQML